VQPAKAAIVNLPAIFYTTLPDHLDLTTTAGGRTVALHATPAAYVWDWGDGTTTTTTEPGAPYPHQSVTHTYHHPGTVTATVTVYWQATYTITGVPGTFTVTGPLTALPHAVAGPRRIPVAEARAHLVS
jgi:PKD repeat protein